MKASILLLVVYTALALSMNLDSAADSSAAFSSSPAAASHDETVEPIKDRIMTMDPASARNGLVVLEMLLSGNATVLMLKF